MVNLKGSLRISRPQYGDGRKQIENPVNSTALRWADLVAQIHEHHESAMEQLYRVFLMATRPYLRRHLGAQDLDDHVHDLFLVIVQSIQKGKLREPERLMGFVHTIIRRQVAAQIDVNVKARGTTCHANLETILYDYCPNPERIAIAHENRELARRILNSLSRRDREILARFYLDDQPATRICREMGLTATQFRLYKHSALERFGERGRAILRSRTSSSSTKKPREGVHERTDGGQS